MTQLREWYYNEATRLGYTGPLRWPSGSLQQWQDVLTSQMNQPILDEVDIPDEIINLNNESPQTVNVEETDENDPKRKWIRFRLSEDPVNVTHESVDEIYGRIQFLFDQVVTQVNHLNPKYQIRIADEGLGNAFSSPFTTQAGALSGIQEQLYRLTMDYDGILYLPFIDGNYVEIHYMYDFLNPIQGIGRSIQRANETWFQPKLDTKLNCLFMSIYIHLNWEKDNDLLTNFDKCVKNSKMWKNRLDLPEGVKNHSDAAPLQLIPETVSLNLLIY